MPLKIGHFLFAVLLGVVVSAQVPVFAQDAKAPITLRNQFEPDANVFPGLHKGRLEECADDCEFDAADVPVTASESYIQSFETPPYEDDGETIVDDAGVAVYSFRTVGEMRKAAGHLFAQPNLLFMTRGTELIKVWSDSSRAQEEHFAAARKFYEGRGAKIFIAPEDTSKVMDVVSDEAEEANTAAGADAATDAAEAASPAAEAAAAAARIAACAAKAATVAGETACAAAEAAAAADAAATSQSDDATDEDEEEGPEAAADAEACCSR